MAITEQSAVLSLPVLRVDSKTIQYTLKIFLKGSRLVVKEVTPTNLPKFCPERHINTDGTFCLNFEPAGSLTVLDADSALAWLKILYAFLLLQERSKKLRRWPNKNVWAHGDAAHYQRLAEQAAASLGPYMESVIAAGEVSLKERNSKGRLILELWDNKRHVFSVWWDTRKVIQGRRRCFCQTSGARHPRKLRSCKDHAVQAVNLAAALRGMESEDRLYWKSVRDMPCCGTCDNCPLSKG